MGGAFDLPLLKTNGAAFMAERHLIPSPQPELSTIKQCFPKRKVFKHSQKTKRDKSDDERAEAKKQHKFFVPLSPRTLIFARDVVDKERGGSDLSHGNTEAPNQFSLSGNKH